METDTVKLSDFVTENRITMKCERVDANPHNADWRNADHWKVVLRMPKARMTTYFSVGYDHNGKEPQAADVLDCLASDASSIENSAFEEWARDMGYDEDYRKAEKIYKAVEHGTNRLRKFLGEELFQQLLWHTERL